MSHVTFQTRTQSVQLRGSERLHLGSLVFDIGYALLGIDDLGGYDRWAPLLHEDLRVSDQREWDWRSSWETRIRTHIWVANPVLHSPRGEVRAMDVIYNTAMAAGSDLIKLAARIDGQCEIHGWIPEDDRPWVADLIDQALSMGIYRRTLKGHSQGWEDVTSLLRASETGPVVMSYSVENSFLEDARQALEIGDDDWEDLPPAHRWRKAMDWLENAPGNRRIARDGWGSFRYADRQTVWELFKEES